MLETMFPFFFCTTRAYSRLSFHFEATVQQLGSSFQERAILFSLHCFNLNTNNSGCRNISVCDSLRRFKHITFFLKRSKHVVDNINKFCEDQKKIEKSMLSCRNKVLLLWFPHFYLRSRLFLSTSVIEKESLFSGKFRKETALLEI